MSRQRTRNLRIAMALLGIAGALGFLGWTASRRSDAPEASQSASPPTRTPELAAAAPAPPREEPPPTPADESAADVPPGHIRLDRPITDVDPETHAMLEARLERERAAEARFHEGVERAQVRARDIDTRVKEAFRRVEFEPVLRDGGLMEGLWIRDIEGGSALEQAGFRAGDLLVRIDGRPLDDPAELPDILASAGPELSLCAQRGTTELCRELSLR